MIAATATLTLMVGAALLLGSFLKLGTIANFISDPVLTGFKIGLGLVIVADQMPKLFGIHIAKGRVRPGSGLAVASFAGDIHADTGPRRLHLILVFALENFWPKSPAPLFAVAGGIGASWLLGLQKSGVAVVGNMPAGLPGFHLPGPLADRSNCGRRQSASH